MHGPDRFELSRRLWKAIDLAEAGRESAAIAVCQLTLRGDDEGARLTLDRLFQPANVKYDELMARISELVKSWKEELEQPR